MKSVYLDQAENKNAGPWFFTIAFLLQKKSSIRSSIRNVYDDLTKCSAL